MAWTLVNKCSSNLVPPSNIRTLLPTILYPRDAPANHVPLPVHGDGNCLFRAAIASLYLAMKMPTQLPGRKWPLSYNDMFL